MCWGAEQTQVVYQLQLTGDIKQLVQRLNRDGKLLPQMNSGGITQPGLLMYQWAGTA